MTDTPTPHLLPWTTPTLDLIGTIDDVLNGEAGEGDGISGADPIAAS